MANHSDKTLPSQIDFPVVGIGASAGGIAALETFFEAMPSTPRAAFVVVVHLAPDHVSNLPQMLQGCTSMPVQAVTDAVHIEPGHVYVIAPALELTMVDSYLRVAPSPGRDGQHIAIDLFFRSLAEAHRERAVAIVLSGAGSDGSVGLTRVKELGGMTLAQSPEEAEYNSMPRASIDTGMVDFVLLASEMPERLVELWSNARSIRLPQHPTDDPTAEEATERALREIIVILRTRTSHDFRHYKRATVLRRVGRRLQVNGLADLQQYRDFLHVHPEETTALLQDMLISVTNFFRDREAYDALRDQVLPQIFKKHSSADQVRVWSAGCATGEEAYSIAMLLHEASAKTPDAVPFQVFATDIDERAIAIARNGLYPEAILADVDVTRVRQFFTKEGAHYRVKKELRERVLFALHNVLSDPPFSRLDLICCRNLLIYLNRDAQIEILRTFHFALKPGGYLYLGSSEAADAVSSLFTVVDKKARLYRANVAIRSETPLPMSASGMPGSRATVAVLQPPGKRKFSFGDLHQRLVEQYAPPSVLVSRDSEIVHLSDRAGRFLQYAGGEPSHSIITAVRPELRIELRTAIYQALQTNRSVEARRVRMDRDGRTFYVNMIARPLHDAEANADFVLVLFDEVEDSMSEPHTLQPNDERDPIIAQLERELQRTKEQLQATIEQSETSTEELKASNEELQAINEELRSATEELETSKEELQSINEELTTVNAELKSKVEETGKINDDLQNLITANDIGTIFVDRNICIKRYTPRATDVFSIIASDIGRSLLDITHRLEYDKLADDAAEAFDSLRLIERELRSTDGRWYLARFLPYRTTEDRIDGAVLSFVDITSRRAAEERLSAHELDDSASRTKGDVDHDRRSNEAQRRADEFLAIVSHELKHPLNLISASTELIARSPQARENPLVSRAANTIRRTVIGQAQIIDDLLDMSRLRTGKLSITRGAVDLGELVARICEAVADEAATNGVTLTANIGDGPIIVDADLTRVEQIVWNLVSNALKFTNAGDTITVSLASVDDRAVLSVADTGAGIDADTLPHVFDMFRQGRPLMSSRRSGLGIGLSLVRELAAMHGGTVRAESDGPGTGATFVVELPRVNSGLAGAATHAQAPVLLRDLRVLVVDDDRETVDTFSALLEMEGADVAVATNAHDALRIVDERPPQLILSDIGMPDMSGLQFIEQVRQRNGGAEITAIALSGYSREEDVEAATQAGFDAHLTKPVMLDVLVTTVARLRQR